jgi:hypothetical protein
MPFVYHSPEEAGVSSLEWLLATAGEHMTIIAATI